MMGIIFLQIMTVIHTALDSSSFRVRYATLELVEEVRTVLTILLCFLFPLLCCTHYLSSRFVFLAGSPTTEIGYA